MLPLRGHRIVFQITELYARLYGIVKDNFGVNLRGLGFALRLIKTDRVIHIDGRKMLFHHKVAASYARLVAGCWNEPETHVFLSKIIPKLPGTVSFIDIGANVGEMVVDISRYGNVDRIFAFEPNPDCCYAIQKSLLLNGFSNSYVIPKLVGEKQATAHFGVNSRTPNFSSIYDNGPVNEVVEMQMTTLDDELFNQSVYAVMLIDVEGYEPNVLKGGTKFVANEKPLIIFEYNVTSKKHYSLSEVENILGMQYVIYRLRQDGCLDKSVEQAWNCVAVPRDSVFETVAMDFIIQG
jgi:FkbM family methyltransferase